MKVADLMSYRPCVIGAFDKVQAAAQLMRAQVVGVLPVVDHGKLVGVVTDRDLVMRCVASGKHPSETEVREVMSLEPATCRPDDTLKDAVDLMVARRVRRLIVVDESGVAGVLSTDDLMLLQATWPVAGRVLQHAAMLRGELDGTFAESQP